MNQFLRSFAQGIPKPDAIIVFSAHWEEEEVSVTCNPDPSLLFDYYGFPEEAYNYSYPASGQDNLSNQLRDQLESSGIRCRLDPDRGFDHGLFVPLMLMYPQADVPCVQISLSKTLDPELHIRIGESLQSFKNQNLLFLGSGFSFHNLPVLMGRFDEAANEKNGLFESWLNYTCCDTAVSESDRRQALVDWDRAPGARFCHPREEHLLPLHICYGLAGKPAIQVFSDQIYGVTASAYCW